MDSSPPGSSVHGFSRQEYWSGLPFPSPGDLPDPRIEPTSPTLAGGLFYHWAPKAAQQKIHKRKNSLNCVQQLTQEKLWDEWLKEVVRIWAYIAPWLDFPGGASGKEPSCRCRRQKMQVWSLGWENPSEEGMETYASVLAWRISQTEEPRGLQSLLLSHHFLVAFEVSLS